MGKTPDLRISHDPTQRSTTSQTLHPLNTATQHFQNKREKWKWSSHLPPKKKKRKKNFEMGRGSTDKPTKRKEEMERRWLLEAWGASCGRRVEWKLSKEDE